MPKIFVLRHQLAEQQAKLKLQAKGGSDNSGPGSSSSDDEKLECQGPSHEACIVYPSSPPEDVPVTEQPLELISRQQTITGRHLYILCARKGSSTNYLIRSKLVP